MPVKELQKIEEIIAEALQLSPEAREMIIEQILKGLNQNQISTDQDEEKIWETIANINKGKKVKKPVKNQEIDELLYA